MGYWIRGRIPDEQKNPITRALIAVYRPCLEWVLRWPKSTLAIAVLALATTLWPLARLGGEFLPQARRGRSAVHALGLAGAVGAAGHRAAADQQPDDQDGARGRARLRQGRPRRDGHRSGAAGDVRDHGEAQAARAMAARHDAGAADRGAGQAVKIPGLSNIWIPPIRNRIDMLATGIKSPIGVKVTWQRSAGDRSHRSAGRAGRQGRAGSQLGAGRAPDGRPLRRCQDRSHWPRGATA